MIRIRKKIDSETLHLPELKRLVGQTVEITISENPESATADEFYTVVGRLPDSESDWADEQERLRAWRTNPRFERFWPMIDRLLALDFAATRPWAAAAQAVGELKTYDSDAWRKQREYDLQHANDHLP